MSLETKAAKQPAARLEARVSGAIGGRTIEVAFDTAHGPLVIVGPNGSGKTTLLLMLLGAHPAQSGRIAVGEHVLFDSAQRVDVPIELRQLGYVPQGYALFPHASVRSNVEFAASARGAKRERVAELLADLELTALAERRATQLSGGERQKVALARALAAEPRALLLDEPLAALDVAARRSVRDFLRAYLLKLALPCVIVTHDPQDARVLGAEVAVLEAGRITQRGAWDELARAPATDFVRELVAATRA